MTTIFEGFELSLHENHALTRQRDTVLLTALKAHIVAMRPDSAGFGMARATRATGPPVPDAHLTTNK
jgi:hypothetical protein